MKVVMDHAGNGYRVMFRFFNIKSYEEHGHSGARRYYREIV